MSRQIINRILIGVFIILMIGMGVVYIRQEAKLNDLKKQQLELEKKQQRIEFIVQEYLVLLDNVNSRNFIIRMAREKFGWVFDNEKIFVKDDYSQFFPPASTPGTDIEEPNDPLE